MWPLGPIAGLSCPGQLPFEQSGGLVSPGDRAAQAGQVDENICRFPRGAGASFADVVRPGSDMTGIDQPPILLAEYDRVVDVRRPPASTGE